MTAKKQSDNVPGTEIAIPGANIQGNALAALESGQTGNVDLNPKSVSFENVGETRRGIFQGIQLIDDIDEETGEDRSYKVAVFIGLNAEGKFEKWSNGGANLVRGCQFLSPGMAYDVTYTGDKQMKLGKMKEYSIYPVALPQ